MVSHKPCLHMFTVYQEATKTAHIIADNADAAAHRAICALSVKCNPAFARIPATSMLACTHSPHSKCSPGAVCSSLSAARSTPGRYMCGVGGGSEVKYGCFSTCGPIVVVGSLVSADLQRPSNEDSQSQQSENGEHVPIVPANPPDSSRRAIRSAHSQREGSFWRKHVACYTTCTAAQSAGFLAPPVWRRVSCWDRT